ncbi:MAG TPA: ABC transporter ATP-binding protein [Candidatus Eisenbacteria bacterium]|nr:ABC transporter ATP-binding protein [Candidatus Eisenbacteria bacterium]
MTVVSTAVLELEGIDVFYGRVQALRGVSLHVDQGEIVTLIGANGAGKTTTLRAISGLTPAAAGRVLLRGVEITRMPAEAIVAKGVGHAPEGRRIFSRMTVDENLDLGAFIRKDGARRQDLDRVFTLFPRLKERQRQIAGTLSGGEQQMLAIGRAMMSRPKVLLLDEPSLGLAPILVETIFQVIREVNAEGTTVLLIEQNALKALSVAHRGYVLETGRIVKEGTARQLLDSPDVQKAYLGV